MKAITINPEEFTETQQYHIEQALYEVVCDHLDTAKNLHLWALGSDTQESAVQFARFEEEHRVLAAQFLKLANEYSEQNLTLEECYSKYKI